MRGGGGGWVDGGEGAFQFYSARDFFSGKERIKPRIMVGVFFIIFERLVVYGSGLEGGCGDFLVTLLKNGKRDRVGWCKDVGRKAFDGETCIVIRTPLLSLMFNEDTMIKINCSPTGRGPAVDPFRFVTYTVN